MIPAYVIGYHQVQNTVRQAFVHFAKEEIVPVKMLDTKHNTDKIIKITLYFHMCIRKWVCFYRSYKVLQKH